MEAKHKSDLEDPRDETQAFEEMEQALSYEEFRKWRPSWTRKLRRNTEYIIFLAGIFLAERCSLARLQALGRLLGVISYRILRKERGIALLQLTEVYPELSLHERKTWCRECFTHFGQLFTKS